MMEAENIMLQKEDAERLLEILKMFTKNDTCQIDDSSFSLLFRTNQSYEEVHSLLLFLIEIQ